MREQAEALNDIMARWHTWSSHYAFGKGYPSSDMTCRSARASRQYDDSNGALDAKLEADTMETVDAVANNIAQPYLSALHVQARNLAVGVNVWRSPRLPTDHGARMEILAEARKRFANGLATAGVL